MTMHDVPMLSPQDIEAEQAVLSAVVLHPPRYHALKSF